MELLIVILIVFVLYYGWRIFITKYGNIVSNQVEECKKIIQDFGEIVDEAVIEETGKHTAFQNGTIKMSILVYEIHACLYAVKKFTLPQRFQKEFAIDHLHKKGISYDEATGMDDAVLQGYSPPNDIIDGVRGYEQFMLGRNYLTTHVKKMIKRLEAGEKTIDGIIGYSTEPF